MAVHLTDAELAQQLAMHFPRGTPKDLLVVADAYHCLLYCGNAASSDWLEIGVGDIAKLSLTILNLILKQGRMHWIKVDKLDPRIRHENQSVVTIQDKDTFKAWLSHRETITLPTGRQGDISADVKREVERLAAWRCQFEGCGEDLSAHIAGQPGNYAYLAHIIAASSDGPRGNTLESGLLANDATNIMLMCDKCHRLVDRVDPDKYDENVLRGMRTKHISEVKRLLDTLRFPVAQMLVIGGNVTTQNAQFDARAAEEAMWQQGLRATTSPQWFSQNANFLWDTSTPNYWETLFVQLQNDIPRLRSLLTGQGAGGTPPLPLAVFPLHVTSIQILTGRLLGESSTVHLFQFHRDQQQEPGRQWSWPTVQPPAIDKFKVQTLREKTERDSEALLLVHLTARVPGADLPDFMYQNGSYVMPTVEVSLDSPTYSAIAHPTDLERLGVAVDEALRKLQDAWHVNKIHLIAIAPATACVRLGQKLQARHHRPVTLYERAPTNNPAARGSFVPTIEIRPTEISLPSTGTSFNLV